ncbi:hypothetical protein IG631_24224 [Alternaria alternata]|nr:hypothetical protein IG631_24224 [Alternaria alternata]
MTRIFAHSPLPRMKRSCSRTFRELAELRSHRKEPHETKVIRCECHRGDWINHVRRRKGKIATQASLPFNSEAVVGRGKKKGEERRTRNGRGSRPCPVLMDESRRR